MYHIYTHIYKYICTHAHTHVTIFLKKLPAVLIDNFSLEVHMAKSFGILTVHLVPLLYHGTLLNSTFCDFNGNIFVGTYVLYAIIIICKILIDCGKKYITNLLSTGGKKMPCITMLCMRLIMIYGIKINIYSMIIIPCIVVLGNFLEFICQYLGHHTHKRLVMMINSSFADFALTFITFEYSFLTKLLKPWLRISGKN